MQPRRSFRLAAGTLVLALPLLGSCGFDKATNVPYTPGAGTNAEAAGIKVRSATIIAAQPHSGTFVAGLADDEDVSDGAATLESLSSDGQTTLEFSSPDGIEVQPRGYVNLADESPITVAGDFEAGDFLPVTLSFSNGDSISLDVPVVYACDEYAGLDESASATDLATPSSSSSSSASSSASPSSSASASASSADVPAPGEPYDCREALIDEGPDTEGNSQAAEEDSQSPAPEPTP